MPHQQILPLIPENAIRIGEAENNSRAPEASELRKRAEEIGVLGT